MESVNSNLTPKQKAIFDYLGAYFARRGYTPSYKEIADNFRLKSPGSVAQYLDALEEKGYLTRGNGNRQIKLNSAQDDDIVEVPLLGIIAAGAPIEPIENPEPISVPGNMLPRSAMSYALSIRGDSMIDDGICDGDIILVKHQKTASHGDIVVAITEQGATLKRFCQDEKGIRLEPRNKKLQPIYPLELEIRGIFAGLIRRGEEIAA